MFDLRLPSGLFFVITGAVLIVTTDPGHINLYSGLAMFVFGAALLLLAWRKNRVRKSAGIHTE
jgi:hypothetical protein